MALALNLAAVIGLAGLSALSVPMVEAAQAALDAGPRRRFLLVALRACLTVVGASVLGVFLAVPR